MEVIDVTWFPGPSRTIIVEPVELPGPADPDEPQAPQPAEPAPAKEPVEVPIEVPA
jgi:hypothetical protein